MTQAPPRILIVEEDRLLGEFYSCLLGLQGYVPVWVGSSQEAQRQLEQAKARFALAVIDLLPPGDGYWDFVNFLRSHEATAEMPIITVTGITLSHDELERLKQTSSAVLLKGSFELGKFKDTVAQLSHSA